MARGGVMRLRNKIVECLNLWPLEVHVIRGDSLFTDNDHGALKHHKKLIYGVKTGGRAVLLYPIGKRTRWVPKAICKLMIDFEDRGAIVGCCHVLGDSWDIVAENEREYKRKRRTYLHRWNWEQYKKRKGNYGQEGEEE